MGDTKYLFLGGLFPKEKEREIFENTIGAMQNAANVLQWNFVKGFDANLEEPIKIINSLYIGSYPKRYKKMTVPSYPFSHTAGAEDFNVGFCNLTGYKNFSRTHRLKKSVTKWIKDTPGKKVVFAYAMTDVMIAALKCAKKLGDNVTTCLIVPDLPQYMRMSAKRFSLYKFLKKIDIKKQYADLKYVDKFVLLTEHMKEMLPEKDYTVVEGIARGSDEEKEVSKSEFKTVLYTGGLTEKYGVVNLVDAFMKIESPEYRLVICGTGDAVGYIQQMQKINDRIEYKGLVPNNEVLKLQKEATVLVNPRQNNEVFTRYSFPSKILEYMSSGTPVLCYKLDGIPDEYDEFLYYVENDSVEAFSKRITDICEQTGTVLDEFGHAAKKFVLDKKSAAIQTKKVLDMCER